MKKLRAAVVGVGYLGVFHAQKYRNQDGVELVGVFDVNQGQAEKVAASLGVAAFQSLEELKEKEVDLATVACSTQAHFEVASKLISYGIHLNIEKPITAQAHQARELIGMARSRGVTLTVGHIERFNPAYRKWRVMAGDPKFIEFERMGPFKARGSDVSVVHDLMIHDLDLLLAMKLGNIQALRAQGSPLISKSLDWAVVWISFDRGTQVCLKASRVSPVAVRVLKSFDSESHWTVNLATGDLERVRFTGEASSPLIGEKIVTEKVDGLQVETEAFVSSVRGRSPVVISAEEGLAALELVEKICSELNHG